MKKCEVAKADPIEWPRANPAELAKFNQITKVCTMNCGPHRDDPRSDAERRFLCGDCLTMKVPNVELTGKAGLPDLSGRTQG